MSGIQQTMSLKPAGGGGGGGAYQDDIVLASATTTSDFGPGLCLGSQYNVTGSGTISKLRVGLVYVFADGTIKAVVCDSSGNAISGASGSVGVLAAGGDGQVVEITGLSGAVSAGQISVIVSCSTNQILIGTLSSALSGLISFGDNYSTMPVSSTAGFTTFSFKLATGVFF